MHGQNLEETRKARQEILNAVAHELGTPLTPVLIHVRRMQELASDRPEMRASIRVVARNMERLIARLRGIIKVTQLDSDHFPVKMRIVRFDSLVQQSVEAYRPAAKAADLRLEFHRRAKATVRCDPERIGEVVANLLDNAVRFSPPRTKIMVIVEEDASHAILRVKDHGVGFRPKDRKSIFEAFSQLESGLPHAYEGAGLGLFISKGITDLHAGEIDAHSDGPGLGATFTLKLSIAKPTPVPIIWDEPMQEVEFYRRVKELV